MKLFLHVHTKDRSYKPIALRDAWEESKHPRGHPGNPGQFVSKGQGRSTTKTSPPPQRLETRTKPKTTEVGGHQLPLNPDGTVTLYHATKTPEAARHIVNTKQLKSAGEPSVYLSTSKSGTGYGDHVVAVRVNPRHLEIDDEFPDGRADFRIDKPNVQVEHAEHVEAPLQESPPQERATSEGKTRQPKAPEMPPELKPHATQYPDNYWTFEPSGDRYMSQHFNLETPGGAASLVLSKESPDWHLFLLDAPIGKENIFGQGQTALEKELIKQGMLSGPSPKKITLPKNVKVTAKAPTKATFSGSDKQENATGYAIDDEVTGRKYVIVSDESDSWKISRPGQTIGRHGRGQESLNDALSSFARKKEIPKPETGSRQDQAASELSKIRVEEAVSRYHKSSFSKPDKEQMYRDIGQAVFDYMGIDKSVGFRVGEPYEFKVGDKIFRSGGHFDPRVNAVSVFTNNEPELVDKLIAHESMHAKFDAVGRAYRKETNQLGKLDYEQYEKVLKPDGSVRDEYKDQYPLHAAMPMGFGLLQGSSRDKLQEDDGCTDYSRAYWEAVKTHPGEARSDPLLAINETLAEMSMLDREGSLPRMLWYKNSKTYKPLYKLIHDQYPHAVEYLKD